MSTPEGKSSFNWCMLITWFVGLPAFWVCIAYATSVALQTALA